MSEPITSLTPAEAQAAEQHVAKERYWLRALVGIDQCANDLTGGSPDETISSRMARWSTEDSGLKRRIGSLVSRGLDLFQRDHGAKAEAGDFERAAVVEKIEQDTGDL